MFFFKTEQNLDNFLNSNFRIAEILGNQFIGLTNKYMIVEYDTYAHLTDIEKQLSSYVHKLNKKDSLLDFLNKSEIFVVEWLLMREKESKIREINGFKAVNNYFSFQIGKLFDFKSKFIGYLVKEDEFNICDILLDELKLDKCINLKNESILCRFN